MTTEKKIARSINLHQEDEMDYLAKIDGLEDLKKSSNHPDNMDLECQSQKAFFREAWSVVTRTQDKLDKLEADTNVNRATMDNRRHFQKLTSEAILHMEYMGDQVTLGLLSKEIARKQLAQVYKACQARTKRVRWVRRNGGGVNGYIPRCGYSVTNLRAMANTALTVLEEMGYHIPDSWWLRDSKRNIVVHEFSEQRERQDRDGEDWAREIETMFYELD